MQMGISACLYGETSRMYSVAKYACIGLLVGLLSPLSASCAERLVDSADYKDPGFQKGCITDYSDMVSGYDADWAWVKPGVKLSAFAVVLGKVENRADAIRNSQLEELKGIYKEILEKLKGNGSGALTADICIFDYQPFSPGKAWIPFVGGHQMQAGIGTEVVVKEKGNSVLAKFRLMSRAGTSLTEATSESASQIKYFITKN